MIYVDAEVAGHEVFGQQDLPITLNAKGGGGTDFRPAFKWVEESGIELSCMIYFTDLYGKFPDNQPEYPVLWATIGTNHRPPFGEHLEIA